MHQNENEAIYTLSQWIRESNHIVFLGGAGTSTESGIPSFRGLGSNWTTSTEHVQLHHQNI